MQTTNDFLPLDFVVVGGGIAGLTSALSLSRAGHRVTLLEQGTDETPLAGGCRLAPNMTRILYRWGMEQDLKKYAVISQYLQFVRYDTGKVTAGGEWVDEFRTESGGEFLSMRYSDFRRVLLESTRNHGVTIRLNAEVASLNVRPERPSAVLKSGEEIFADVLIGADGVLGSLTRREMLGGEDPERYRKVIMYNALIPTDKMEMDPQLAPFVNEKHEGTIFVWFGDSFGVMGFLTETQREKEFGIHVYAPWDASKATMKKIVERAELLQALPGCEERLHKLAELATTIIAIPVTDKPHLKDWVHPNGTLVIIGEAAHPLTAGSMYAISLAAEDGMMLGHLFSRITRKDQISRFLSALSEKRNERISVVEQIQRVNPVTLALPAGVDQARYLKTTVEHMDNAAASAFTEEAIRNIFSYDPEEDADDWWMEWGLLQERATRTVPLPSTTFTVDVHQ